MASSGHRLRPDLAPFVYHGERRRVDARSRYGRQALGRLCYTFIHQVDGTSEIGPSGEAHVLRPGRSAILDPGIAMRWRAPAHIVRAPFDLLPRRRLLDDIARVDPADTSPQPPLRDLLGAKADGLIPEALATQAADFAGAAGVMRPKRARDVWMVNALLGLLLSRYVGGWMSKGEDAVADPSGLAFASLVEERLMHLAPQGITVKDLATRLGMSPASLGQRYRRQRGTGPKRFLTRYRIDRAKELLRKGNDPIEAVAAAVGFGSAVAFRTNFKRETGMSPSRWRLLAGLHPARG